MCPSLNSLWGKTINEYFLKDPTNAFFPKNEEIPSGGHVKAVVIPQLNRIREPTQDTCSFFKGVLSLLQDPKELHSLNNTMLLSRCMHALQNYADDSDPRGNKLFTYEYGFLCFRVIVLLMQVGILAHTKTFNAFAKQTSDMSDPHDVSVALSDFVLELMINSTKRESNPRDWLLGLSSSRTGDRVSLKMIGGLTDVDVSSLVRIIWQDRKRFSEICGQTSTPGWALLLVLLGEHLQWASDAGWHDQEEWDRFRVLAFRYSLFASPGELVLIETVCTRSGRNQSSSFLDEEDRCYEKSLVDIQDARSVLEAYLACMQRSIGEPISLPLSILLLEFLRQNAILSIGDLMPSLAGSLCLSIWHQLEATICRSTPPNDMANLVLYTTRVFETFTWLYDKYYGASATIISLSTAIIQANFLDLLARMVLLPLSLQDDDPRQEKGILEHFRSHSKKKLKITPELLPRWTKLIHHSHILGQAYARSSGQFSDKIIDSNSFHSDYAKIWRCFDFGFPRFCGPCWEECCHPYSVYIDDCRAAISKLTLTFKHPDEHLSVRCAYPRCSAALIYNCTQFTCDNCLVALYCSHICRARHWIAPIESHRELCTYYRSMLLQT